MSYPTLAQLKTFLGISGSSDDTPLGNCLAGAIGFVEKETGRIYAGQADVTKRFFRRNTRNFPNLVTLMLFEDLATVTSITHPRKGILTQNTDYIFEPVNAPYYKIVLTDDIWDFPSLTDAVVIVGKWGYSAACPNDLFLVIMELAASAYHGRNSGGGGDVVMVNNSGAILRPKTLSEYHRSLLGSYKR